MWKRPGFRATYATTASRYGASFWSAMARCYWALLVVDGFAISRGHRRPPLTSRFGLRPSLLRRAAWWPLVVFRQGGVGRPGGEGNRPPYPPACAEAETRRRRGIFMWAGAGVGGLRTPARCLDSDAEYPCRGYLNLRIRA